MKTFVAGSEPSTAALPAYSRRTLSRFVSALFRPFSWPLLNRKYGVQVNSKIPIDYSPLKLISLRTCVRKQDPIYSVWKITI